MIWSPLNRQGNECFKVRWELVKWTRGQGLDVGCGPGKTFSHFIGVDNGADQRLFNIKVNPDVWVTDCGDLSVFADNSMSYVLSSHLLEHVEFERVPAVLKEWVRVIKDDGYLILYLPDEDEYPKIGVDGCNPDHKWNVSLGKVLEGMDSLTWDLVDFQKRNKDEEYSLFFVFQKKPKGHQFSWKEPKTKKPKVGLVRYGAFGDLLQASSVLAGLKKEGYHVTLFTSPPGVDVIKHDPNVDEFYLQDKDQVPNQNLGEFWAYHEKSFDKWINLSESVEGTFLSIPGRVQHEWTPQARHARSNGNYLEFQHQIAGLPHVPRVKFYATEEEKRWASQERSKISGLVILWSLAGSSVHKTWGGLDNVIARILIDYPTANIVLVGGPDCVLLEQGWEKEPRVHLKCGKWSIRETLSFVEHADVVIGPETGVLNSVAHSPMPKVVFLSHSTHENLTRDWVNVHPLASEKTSCPGRGDNKAPACHMMHYNWKHCKNALAEDKKPSGIAQCQADISIDQAYKVIWHAIRSILEKAA